jgi:hypothetical protein
MSSFTILDLGNRLRSVVCLAFTGLFTPGTQRKRGLVRIRAGLYAIEKRRNVVSAGN